MSETKLKPGSIGWTDLTVPNATEVRDFYSKVAGWGSTDVDMGGYSDYGMTLPGEGGMVAGICHARGVNAGLPPCWIVYIIVPDLDASVRACARHGGEIVAPPKSMGGMGRYCIIRDPAGAVAGLFEPPPPAETKDESAATKRKSTARAKGARSTKRTARARGAGSPKKTARAKAAPKTPRARKPRGRGAKSRGR
jgi:predicted enzyme related to lactoylglutathione lyase